MVMIEFYSYRGSEKTGAKEPVLPGGTFEEGLERNFNTAGKYNFIKRFSKISISD